MTKLQLSMYQTATCLLAAMALGAFGQQARAVEFTSTSQSISVFGFAEDGQGNRETMEDSSFGTDPTFDEAVSIAFDALNGQFSIGADAAQTSSVSMLDARTFQIVGEMDLSTFINFNHFDDDEAIADTLAGSGMNATFNSDLPIDWHLVGDIDVVGEGGGGINVFDFSDFTFSGTSFDLTGRASAGEHTFSASMQSAGIGRDRDVVGVGTMNFVLTGVVVPSPAAVGPGLVLLGGLLLRRRRATETDAA